MEEIELSVQLVRVKPQVNQLAGTYTNLLLGGNFNVEELDYGCRPSSTPVAVTDRCEVNEDDSDCEDEAGDEDDDDESDGDGDVQVDGHISSFLAINQLIENEQGRYLMGVVSPHSSSRWVFQKNIPMALFLLLEIPPRFPSNLSPRL